MLESMVDPSYPRSWYIALSNITPNQFDTLCFRREERGFPIFEALGKLYTMYKEALKGRKNESIDWDLKLYEQKLIKEIICNQSRLMTLVPKRIAEDRMKNTLFAVSQSINNHLKIASVKIAQLPEGSSPREIEEVLAQEYKGAIDRLQADSEVISWESDIDSEMMKIQLTKLASDDPFIKEGTEGLYGENFTERA